ncbi:uncharacterized protein UTRI_02814_B [Ustilago trichophora]|uniref:Cytoplasmic tRNA 2-thiolation protein 2 n=1 Tax=Ustilago trichophora TaxID=86804 RepID=A0A5C3E683_9BASI|nr:uncharacterized protein UTRI_02814_B [Ustilago trichophora]
MPCPQPDEPAPPAASDPTSVKTCVRCKAEPAIAIFRDSIYCQSCALIVFYQKAKSGLEYARGAGLAKYVAAATSGSFAASTSASAFCSSAVQPLNGDGTSKRAKQIHNGGGNAEVDVSANIAIAFSGGASSRALLRTATQYFRPETSFATRTARRAKARGEAIDTPTEPDAASCRKRGAANSAGRFNEIGKIFVIFIDDSSIIPSDEHVDRTEAARRMVEEENCPDLHFVPLKLEDIYATAASPDSFSGVPWKLTDIDTQLLSGSTSTITDPTQALKDLFTCLHPPSTPRTAASAARTRVEDLHRLLISTLLRRTAAQLDCAALLLGESATRISIRLIEDLAKGAGHKLPVQGSDAAWIDDLLVVRPLKGHLLQEVLFYTSTLGLGELEPVQNIVHPAVSLKDVLGNTNATVPVMDKSSIARLTETFILNLEKGVASTVTTIGKTGGKLVLNNHSSSSADDPVASSNGDVSRSTQGFQNVGPSVSLKSRSAKVVEDKMAGLNLTKAKEEPRIGSRGIKLAQTSAACFKWSTKKGCALCGMPSQHPNARHWKRDITISSLAETAPSTAAKENKEDGLEEGWIVLADHLCYACLLVLAPPGNAAGEEGQASLLPTYVLDHILRSMSELGDVEANALRGASARDDEAGDNEAEQNGKGRCGSHNSASQPLSRSKIKAQINEFLLDDA